MWCKVRLARNLCLYRLHNGRATRQRCSSTAQSKDEPTLHRWGGDRLTSRRGVERRRHAIMHALKQGPGLKRLVSFILLSYKRAFLLLEQRNESYAVPAKTARGPVDGDADRIT